MIRAQDKYGNAIGQNIQAYTINVQSGDGKIYDGASANTSIKFDNFAQSSFIYQAPTDLKENKGITITIAQDQTQGKLLTNESETPVPTVQKKLIVAKGIVTVLKNNVVLYQTDNKQITQPKISFDLPKDESGIQYIDQNGVAQIKPENIPSLMITIKDKNGNTLESVANVVSEQ